MDDLVKQLQQALNAAPKGNRVVTIHLFGIKHAARLTGIDLQELARRAGIGKSFGTELRKWVRLASHVELK